MSISHHRRAPRASTQSTRSGQRASKHQEARKAGSWTAPLGRILRGSSPAPRCSSGLPAKSLVSKLALMLKQSASAKLVGAPPPTEPPPRATSLERSKGRNRSAGWACRLVGALTSRAASGAPLGPSCNPKRLHRDSSSGPRGGGGAREPAQLAGKLDTPSSLVDSMAQQQQQPPQPPPLTAPGNASQCCSASLASTWLGLECNGETTSSTSGCFVSISSGSHCSLSAGRQLADHRSDSLAGSTCQLTSASLSETTFTFTNRAAAQLSAERYTDQGAKLDQTSQADSKKSQTEAIVSPASGQPSPSQAAWLTWAQPVAGPEVRVTRQDSAQAELGDQDQESASHQEVAMAGGLLSAGQQSARRPAGSLLSRARNSTINLASLAGVAQRTFHGSASAGHLWATDEAAHLSQLVPSPEGAASAHQKQAPAAPAKQSKDKRRRQKEAERIEKLKMLVSYLRSGSQQQLIQPVRLEADELELAQRYKQSQLMCDDCLQALDQQQAPPPGGSSGSRTPATCCQHAGCSNGPARRMFYIDELDQQSASGRKGSDTSDTTQTSQQLLVVCHTCPPPSSSSQGEPSSPSEQLDSCQYCLGRQGGHLRSMVTISSSELVGARDLPARSWSTELFLSSTPTQPASGRQVGACLGAHPPAQVTGSSQSEYLHQPACSQLLALAANNQNQHQLNITAASSSTNTSGVGYSAQGSLPTVASAQSFNLSTGAYANQHQHQPLALPLQLPSSHLATAPPQHQNQLQANTAHNIAPQQVQSGATLSSGCPDNDCEESCCCCCCSSSATSSSSHTNSNTNNNNNNNQLIAAAKLVQNPQTSSSQNHIQQGATKTSAWTNPQTLATWIDQEVNSLVHDLESKSSLIDTKRAKSSKRSHKHKSNKL